MRRELTLEVERFPVAGRFTIARGSRTEIAVVTATVTQNGARGRGECVPYARYGENIESVSAQIESLRERIEAGLDRSDLQDALPAGAARNAVDCAFWDLHAKLSGIPAHVAAGLDRVPVVTTAFTISLDTPEVMAEATERAAFRPILKVKLGGEGGDKERIAAVRRAAPDATLIADANEGWSADNLTSHLNACADAGFVLVEQPVRAGRDDLLANRPSGVLICADESLHDRGDLPRLAGLYDAINIKLDKAGGLTEALALATDAQQRGLSLMIGCMLGTSLAMAPASLLTPKAQFVDLDAPLLLARDREGGLRYEGSTMFPPPSSLWG